MTTSWIARRTGWISGDNLLFYCYWCSRNNLQNCWSASFVLNKKEYISQATLSKAFTWMKFRYFDANFSENGPCSFRWREVFNALDNDLVKRWQAINSTSNNADLYMHHPVSVRYKGHQLHLLRKDYTSLTLLIYRIYHGQATHSTRVIPWLNTHGLESLWVGIQF